MPKRALPTSVRSPCPNRCLKLVSPINSSTSLITPSSNVVRAQALFHTPTIPIIDILEHRIDASTYSPAQLSWIQSHDQQRYRTCLDFARCKESVLRTLFPPKFGGNNIIPVSHRHSVTDIRHFQELGNKQQLYLIAQDNASPAPLLPELKNYLCLGLSVQYLVQNVVNETRKTAILDGYCHIIREAIRSRADNIHDQLYHEYYMSVQVIIVSNNSVHLILNEMNT